MSADLGIVNCVEETPKAFKFQKVGTDEPAFWVPKKMIELGPWRVGFQGSLLVNEWWLRTIRRDTQSLGPTQHQQGLCKICKRPYQEHPERSPRSSFDRPGDRTLCDGAVFRTATGMKVSLGDYHTREWWREVQEARQAMGIWKGEDCFAEHQTTCRAHCRER
jgi:hypothetical protein